MEFSLIFWYISCGGSMDDLFDKVSKVLALFDVEDVKYIKSKIYLDYQQTKNEEKKYVKKLGAKVDAKRGRTLE